MTIEMPRCSVGSVGDITHRLAHTAGFKTLQSERVRIFIPALVTGPAQLHCMVHVLSSPYADEFALDI
jgi:hypothetical protein